jgi:Domain of unknown function (DUF4124)
MRILLILIFLSSTYAYAEVYKRTNPDGSVEFTDVPNKQKEKPIKLSPLSTFRAPPTPMPQTSSPKTDAPYTYTGLTITSPLDDDAIRANDGSLRVSVSIVPALQPGHSLVLLMDGKVVGKSATGSFALSNVDRGTHSLSAQVQSADGTPQISATPITIHLLRSGIR